MKRTAKTIMAAMAALTVMMSFASCGDTSESSSKSGTVSLVTTTTAAPADSSSEAETTTTAATESETETTTTTSAPDSSEAETTTTTTAEAPKEESFADKLKIKYNGTTFGVGDTFADIEKSLGGYSDHFQSAHCTDEGMDDIYVYSGMDVTVFDGKVSNVMLYDNGNTEKDAPETVCGLKTGLEDADSLLGKPVKASDTDAKYDCDGTWVYVSKADGKAYTIIVAELEQAIPEFTA